MLKHVIGTCFQCSWSYFMSQPYFGQVWGWSPTLGKKGEELESSETPECLEFDSKAQTPRIGVFLVSLERSWSANIENGLELAIWTYVAQVMGKRRARSQTDSLTPDHQKSRITSSRPPNWECDTSLERWRRGLQVWFRPHCDQTLKSGVMSSQSPGTPPGTISGQFRDSNLGVPGKRAIWM
jgi:hypothetical protein